MIGHFPGSRSLRIMVLAMMVLSFAGCEEPLVEVDDRRAKMHGLCMGIAPGAEVAAQRRWVLDQPGVFRDVMDKLGQRFLPPVKWSVRHQRIWKQAMREGQALGQDLIRRRIDSYHATALNRCRAFVDRL